MSVPSIANKGNLAVWASYGVRECTAYVSMETYGGKDIRDKILAAIAHLPDVHLLKHAELVQGKKNKNKWAWSIKNNMDKSDSGLVKWYIDIIVSLCEAMENMTL